MLLGVEYLVRNLAESQHFADNLGVLDRGRTDQYRATTLDHFHDFVGHGVVFLAHRAIDFIFFVLTNNRNIGRDGHHVQFVNFPEFTRFGFGRTRHTRQLVVHSEVVLQSHRGVSLRGVFDLHALLSLDGLMQPVGVAATVHDAARLLVHDLHLPVHDDVLDVLLEQIVGFQQLVDGVNPGRFHGIVAY